MDKTRDKPKEEQYKNEKTKKYVQSRINKKFDQAWLQVESEEVEEKGSNGRFSYE